MSLDASIPTFPLKFMTPQTWGVGADAPVMYGPRPLAGAPQSVASGAGRWRIAYKNLRVNGAAALVARALLASIGIPPTPIYVSPMDWIRSPRRLAGLASPATAVSFSDGAIFSDSTRFVGGSPDFKLAANAAAFTQSITIAPQVGGLTLTAGQYLTLDERLHVLVGVWPIGGSSNLNCKIWPPTRAAYASGFAIESENPFCRMLVDVKSAALAPEFFAGRYAYLDLDFVEDNWT